jgi:hypothetical protein
VAAYAVLFFLTSADAGLALEELPQQDCIKCTQNYAYICTQNYAECIAACRGIGATDKDACRRRCIARNGGCGDRVVLKCGTCTPEKFAIPPPLHIQ